MTAYPDPGTGRGDLHLIKSYILQKLIIDLAKQGKSIMFISSEISEMLRTCNRMVIMRDGEKVNELSGDLTQEGVMKAIAGGEK